MTELWRKDLVEWANKQPVVTSCAHCAWTHQGTLEQGRDAHLQHRQEAHGINGKHRRVQSHRSPWVKNAAGLTDNIANARATGAAGWASDDPEWRVV